MKRNLDLIRDILLKIESEESLETSVSDFVNDEYNETTVSAHIALLLDNKYIEATKVRFISSPFDDFRIKRITSSGYDYLESVRDKTIWLSIKEKLKDNLPSASFEIIKNVATALLSSQLEL